MEAPDRSEAKKHYDERRVWLNLADGDSCKVVFIGQSHVRDTVWNGSFREQYNPEKHAAKDIQIREAFNAIVKLPDGEMRMRVFENSKKFWDYAAMRWKKFGVNRWYELERIGEGNKTQYQLDPAEEITPEEMQQIDGLEKIDLAELYKPRKENGETPF